MTAPKNIQQELREILEEFAMNNPQGFIDDEALIPALEAINSLVRECIGEDFPDCEEFGLSSSYCNKCWACKRRNELDFVDGYESAQYRIKDRWFSNKGEGDE